MNAKQKQLAEYVTKQMAHMSQTHLNIGMVVKSCGYRSGLIGVIVGKEFGFDAEGEPFWAWSVMALDFDDDEDAETVWFDAEDLEVIEVPA